MLMQAIVQTAYGSPDALELREVDRPVLRHDGVLVGVHAAALHAGDYFALRGAPVGVRLVVGLLKPKKDFIPGLDVAGRVEEVGKDVTG
jgi:NADPH:quinone reductase-like Zn-dependent oxidoreductase